MDNKNNENEIEVIIGDNSNLKFSEVENLIEELKPKKSEKKSNIIIPKVKKQTDKKDKKSK